MLPYPGHYAGDIEQLAAGFQSGQYSGLVCPACKRDDDRSLSMLIEDDTTGRGARVVRAVCHRASCGFSYSNTTVPAYFRGRAVSNVEALVAVPPSRVRPYAGALRKLGPEDSRWLSDRFQMPPIEFIDFRKSEYRYFVPIKAPDGTRRGWVARRPWQGSPMTCQDDAGPKSLTYMDVDAPVMSWHGRGFQRTLDTICVLVEDQMSAMRVISTSTRVGVALLGTALNQEKVAEIQRYCRNVILALDADATSTAFTLARRWGAAFNSFRVAILSKDLKDCTFEEVARVLG